MMRSKADSMGGPKLIPLMSVSFSPFASVSSPCAIIASRIGRMFSGTVRPDAMASCTKALISSDMPAITPVTSPPPRVIAPNASMMSRARSSSLFCANAGPSAESSTPYFFAASSIALNWFWLFPVSDANRAALSPVMRPMSISDWMLALSSSGSWMPRLTASLSAPFSSLSSSSAIFFASAMTALIFSIAARAAFGFLSSHSCLTIASASDALRPVRT